MGRVVVASFGTALRELREQRGVSLTALSHLVHYSKGHLSKVENGERSATTGLARRCDEALRTDGMLTGLATGQPQPQRGRPARPARLPAGAAHFTGRSGSLGELDSATREHAAAMAVTVISGPPGVGKTALALHWAHLATHRFPDGCLFADLRGYAEAETPAEPAEVLDAFLRALGVPPEVMAAGLDPRSALLRTLLNGKRMLVILDNAAAPEQVRPLLPGAAGCQAIVTSRSRLSGLVVRDAATRIVLDPLPPPEAAALLARVLGPGRLAAEPRAAEEIALRCGYLPLALRIAAERAAARPRLGLADLARQLSAERDRLDVLTAGDADTTTTVRSVFSWSYRALSPTAARMFRLLGLHPGPDVSIPAAAALAAITPPQARRLVESLAAVHLLEETGLDRYRFHDLLRAYAAEQARAHDSDAERRAAMGRLLDHYLATAYAAALTMNPARVPLTPAPSPQGAAGEDIPGHGQATAWFEAERPALLAAIAYAADAGFDSHAWRLAWTLADFLQQRGHWREWDATQQTALAAARRLADQAGQARSHHYLGYACARLRSYPDAHDHFADALAMFRQLGDLPNQAHVHLTAALAFEQQGLLDDALARAGRSLELYQAAGHRAGHANALNAVGWYHTLLGNHARALPYCEQAVDLHRELGNSDGEAATWDSLAHVHHKLGNHARALTCYQNALGLRPGHGDRYNQAGTLTRLGDTHEAAGSPQAARDAWRQALAILDELSHPDAERLRARLDAPSSGTHGALLKGRQRTTAMVHSHSLVCVDGPLL